MKIKIGFIMSKPFLPFTKEINKELENYCSIINLVANENKDVVNLYNNNKNNVDCFVFSGKVFFYYLVNNIGYPNKPCYIIDELQSNIKDIFLNLLLNNRNFDFSKIFIDSAFEGNNYLDVKALLNEDEYPYFNTEKFKDINKSTENTLNKHIELHHKGLINLSITRFGTIVKVLEENDYPYIYMYPPKSYIINFFMQIINSFHSRKNKDQKMGSITILFTPEFFKNKESIILSLRKYFYNYVQIHGYDFTVQRDDEKIEILTTYNDLYDLTKEFKDVKVLNNLREVSGIDLIIGLGSGNNLYQARLNSYKAAYYSREKEDSIYYIDENSRLIGPIGKNSKTDIKSIPDDKIIELSNKFHVNHINLQKIISYTKLINSTKVTGKDLANYLNVTVRSANRIINKIKENGGAVFYYEKLKSGRGRPTRYCDMIFIKEFDLNS